MADQEHVAILRKGVGAWSAWRRAEADSKPDLSYADLSDLHLSRADLSNADLSGAELINADLTQADLTGADLTGAKLPIAKLIGAELMETKLKNAKLKAANLNGARLYGTDLTGADLSDAVLTNTDMSTVALANANLIGAELSSAKVAYSDLSFANLTNAVLNYAHLNDVNLTSANLTGARVNETIFADLNLATVVGLEKCHHTGPSLIDYRTLEKSGPLPLKFLRGIGLPDHLIEHLPTPFKQAIEYFSCFISYSTKDQEFADRIHAELQAQGVRCWFAPHDIPIGGKILDEIDAAIRRRDKLLLILSEHSIKSDWVETEVTTAFEEERKRKQNVLFPIRLDDAVIDTKEPWAAQLRQRNIGDFRKWKDHDAYRRSFDRVLRDLAPKPK
jgi:uncharacterized protein YjbI with pentapeptide repeats